MISIALSTRRQLTFEPFRNGPTFARTGWPPAGWRSMSILIIGRDLTFFVGRNFHRPRQGHNDTEPDTLVRWE